MDKILPPHVNSCLTDYKNQIETLIQKNQNVIDLGAYLQDSNSIQYSSENQQVFIKSNTIQFPQVMRKYLKIPDAKYKIGYLSEINYVWLATGYTLYLWNLAVDDDVFICEYGEIIEHVDLISFPLSNHELLVSTCKQVYVHRINIKGERLRIISKANVPSPGIIMSNIVTTDTKRVFMKGSDGHLYELDTLCDTNGLIVRCKLHCHTVNPLLYYLPSIFKSAPESPVVCIALDDDEKLLYLLLADASIHVVSVQGSHYLPLSRYIGSKLEYIHLIPTSESKELGLMAVANNGDRHYFAYQKPNIIYKYKRPAPPLPGSIFFNKLSNEKIEQCFYRFGVFITSLCKSESKYLVFVSANAVETTESQHILIEDVYQESFPKKIWSIMEKSRSSSLQPCTHQFKTTVESPESPERQFSVLSDDGIVQYTKQRPVTRFEQILRSGDPSVLLEFMKRYSAAETAYLGYVLTCSHQLPEAIHFVRTSSAREEGLLLYFARIVEGIWDMDVKQKSIPQDHLQSAQNTLENLKNNIVHAHIPAKAETLELITRSIEGISFAIFFNSLAWEEVVSSIRMWNRTYTFADLITTEDGAILSQEIILSALSHSKQSNVSNDFNFISNFLNSNCLYFIGQTNVIHYKGIECLYGARNNPNDKQQALDFALSHFTQIISNLDIPCIESSAEEFCTLGDHYGAVQLAFAKYRDDPSQQGAIYPIIISAIEKALKSSTDNDYGKRVLVDALGLTHDDHYHFEIYNWLKANGYKDLLLSLDTASLVRFVKTQLGDKREMLEYLEQYYAYRKQYSLAIDCLYQMAMCTSNITLDDRVGYLNTACDYVALSEEQFDHVKLSLRVAKIQQEVCTALLEQTDSTDAKQTAEILSQKLLSADDLLAQAYTHALHEQALYLMDVMDKYDFKYAESAWRSIIEKCHAKDSIQSKVMECAKRLYPSISSFPVYVIFKILHEYDEKFGKYFASSTLVKAGVPEEVVSDAKSAISSQ